MCSLFLSRAVVGRILCVILLTVLVVGCGNGSNGNPRGGATPTSPAVGAHNEPTTAPIYPSGAGFDVGELLHIESTSLNCALYPTTFSSHKSFASKALVLGTDRLTYDTGEIQEITSYAFDPHSPLPNTIRLVPGVVSEGEKAQHQFKQEGPSPGNSGCKGSLEITNIGKTTIQISQIGIQLSATPKPNTYHYRLIEICTLPNAPSVCPGLGARPLDYTFAFQLKMSSAGTVFQGQMYSNGTRINIGPTLDPGRTAEVYTSFDSSGVPDNLIYSVIPELTLDISGEQRTVLLSPLENTFAFAHQDQFSCYKWQSNTFVLVRSDDSIWCV